MIELVHQDNLENTSIQGNYPICIDGKEVGSLDISQLWGKWYVTVELVDHSLTIEQHLLILQFLKQLGFADDQPVSFKTI